MEKHSSVSAVILAYNGMPKLSAVIDGVLNQTYPVSHIVVVDNNSQDGTDLLLKQYGSRIHVIQHKENLGVGAGHNSGWEYVLRELEGEFIWALEHDCVPAADCLEELLNAYHSFSDQERIGVCVPVQVFEETETNKVRYVWRKNSFQPVKSPKVVENVSKSNRFTFNGLLIRITLIKEVGMLNQDFFVGHEDSEFRMRTQKAGFSILKVSSAIVYHNLLEARREVEFGGRYFLLPKTSVLRSYYEKRNSLFLAKGTKTNTMLMLAQLTKLPVSLIYILILCDDKLRRVQARFYAIRDGLRGDLGRKHYQFLKERHDG